jgi:DNA-binding NtrC family response regulator
VLIVGESGAGKELVARAIHGNSPRRNRPLVVVNCGAIPEHLVESELFGHTRGAYTSADRASPGKFAVADGGTVFLDEVGDLPLAAQVALLRFLQSGELQTVGDASVQPRRTDVRVVAASNRDLATLVAEGRFRGDLLFRLAVFPIHVPPLRDRRDDIPALVRHLLAADPVFRQRGIRAVSVAAMQALKRHPWPGNVRQLRSALVSAAILADSDVVLLRDLPDDILGQGGPAGAGAAFPKLAEVELEHIERALALCGGNRSRAARLLGVHRNTLRARLAELTGTGRGR